jgi:hypothetical protein
MLATNNPLHIFQGNGFVTVTSYCYFKCNKVVTSYFEDQEEFLLYLNKTLTIITPWRKLKTMPTFFCQKKVTM